MALFQVAYSTTPTIFNLHSVAADNAEKMKSLVEAAFAAAVDAGELGLVDIKLSGTGAGPNWECWFVTASTTQGNTVISELDISQVVVAVASNPAEALLRLKEQLTALAPLVVLKTEIAGGGIGTIFMALALVDVTPPG